MGDISQYSTVSNRRRASDGPRSSSSEDLRRSTLGSSSSLVVVDPTSHEGTLRTTIKDSLKRNHADRRKSDLQAELSSKKNRHVSTPSAGNNFLTVSSPTKADLVKKTLPMVKIVDVVIFITISCRFRLLQAQIKDRTV